MSEPKGILQQIKEGGSIDLSKPENKGWIELFRIASLAPSSVCCHAPIHFQQDGIVCTYCGELCEIIEHPNS